MKILLVDSKEDFERMIGVLFTEFEVVVDIRTYLLLVPQLLANDTKHIAEPIIGGLLVQVTIPEGKYKVKVMSSKEIDAEFKENETPEDFWKDLGKRTQN